MIINKVLCHVHENAVKLSMSVMALNSRCAIKTLCPSLPLLRIKKHLKTPVQFFNMLKLNEFLRKYQKFSLRYVETVEIFCKDSKHCSLINVNDDFVFSF